MTRRFRNWWTDRYGHLEDRLGRWAVPAWLVAGLVVLVAATTMVGLVVAALPSGSRGPFAVGAAEWIVERRVDSLTEVAWFVTRLGDSITLVALAVLVGLAWRWRRGDWAGLAVLLGAYCGALVIYSGVKRIVARARPPIEVALGEAPGLSFPSGHTTGSAAVYVALALLVLMLTRQRRRRAAILGGTGLLVVAIGLSRVYLGVHWMSDVLAGLAAGVAWALVVVTPLWARRRRSSRVGDRVAGE